MGRDWSKYNHPLVKRGEILISLSFSLEEKEQGKKIKRPYTYPLDLKSKNVGELIFKVQV